MSGEQERRISVLDTLGDIEDVKMLKETIDRLSKECQEILMLLRGMDEILLKWQRESGTWSTNYSERLQQLELLKKHELLNTELARLHDAFIQLNAAYTEIMNQRTSTRLFGNPLIGKA